jgi:hypothetical protein
MVVRLSGGSETLLIGVVEVSPTRDFDSGVWASVVLDPDTRSDGAGGVLGVITPAGVPSGRYCNRLCIEISSGDRRLNLPS